MSYKPATPRELVLMSDVNVNSLRANRDSLYQRPTPKDIKEVRKLCNLTQIDLAKIVGVSYGKAGSSTVAKWETDPSKAECRAMPYSAWRLLLLVLEIVTIRVLIKG